MPPHFFLSYAPANSSPLVKKFFDDLCDMIRITLHFPRNRVVGFYEESGHQSGGDWSPDGRGFENQSRNGLSAFPRLFPS